jgi:hypothetical protein
MFGRQSRTIAILPPSLEPLPIMRLWSLPTARSAHALILGLGAILWTACADPTQSPLTAPDAQPRFVAGRAEDIAAAIAAQERHNAALLNIPGVIGTAVGLMANGNAAIRVYITRSDMPELPAAVDNIPIDRRVTAQFVALSDPTTRARPTPLGFSIGHPRVTAGTLGARVVDGAGIAYVLSNNHVLAASNAGLIGDPEYQPGVFDGGSSADQIATLAAFRPINFSGAANPFDGAIARIGNPADVLTTTPLDDGYGAPATQIVNDANGDGVFDNRTALLGVPVQKYGRTTKLTHDFIDAVNGTVNVCYEQLGGFCIKVATFTDQLIINASGFSGGGDSGSLIVTNDANRNPIALLFAGSASQTIANRIDLVLNYFGVRVDGGAPPPPPTPVTDAAVQTVSGPSAIVQGSSGTIAVTVRNVGNQSVGAFDVSLADATDAVGIGTQTIGGLAAGASTTVNFTWNTSGRSIGAHTLTATHSLSDDNGANNQASTTVQVSDPGSVSSIHVGDLDGFPQNGGNTWAATVEITVVDGAGTPVNGATVVGSWSLGGLNSNTCTTGEGGGTGTCIVLFPSLKKNVRSVSFTVTSVTMTGRTYQASANADPDGSSNGTVIVVNKP